LHNYSKIKESNMSIVNILWSYWQSKYEN
jgi:hypothetical protein